MAKRSSGCGCFVIGCVAIVVAAVLVVIVTAGGIGFVMTTRLSVNDPVRINALAEDICQCEIPPTFKPVLSIDLWVIRSALYVTEKGVNPPAVLYFMDTPLDAEEVLLRQSMSIEAMAYERLGISNVTDRAITTKRVATVPFEGTNSLAHNRRTVRLEEDGRIMTVHQAVFRAHGRTGVAVYMLFDIDPASDPGPTFIRSIRPAQ